MFCPLFGGHLNTLLMFPTGAICAPEGWRLRLSVDLWLETRSFVEQLDSLLDMVRDSVMIAAIWGPKSKQQLIISGWFGTVLNCVAMFGY